MDEQAPPSMKTTDNSSTLWELLQTFSNEAQAAAKRKAEELSFALDRGNIPLDETLINLSRNRDVLVSAIEDSALPQLPLKIQSQLVVEARKISAQLVLLTNGTDALVTLETAVEDMTATIWYSNLQNMKGEILGFQKKQNQLKSLETLLRDGAKRAADFHLKEQTADSLIEDIRQIALSSQATRDAVNNDISVLAQQLSDAKDAEQKATASLAVTLQAEKSIAESAASSRASAADLESSRTRSNALVAELDQTKATITALVSELTTFRQQTEATLADTQTKQRAEYKLLDERLQADAVTLKAASSEANTSLANTIAATLKASTERFDIESSALVSRLEASEIVRDQKASAALTKLADSFSKEGSTLKDEFRKAAEIAEAKAGTVIQDNNEKAAATFSELERLEDAIREKIQLATNYQLFHSFQTRQLDIAKSKEFWRRTLFYTVLGSFTVSLALIISLHWVHQYNAAFFLRLSISIPLIYAIHFCSTQYSKERQLEEEYALQRQHFNFSRSLQATG